VTTDRVARRVPGYPTSREKRARCGAPDLQLPVKEAGHLMFQLATASRLLEMTNLLCPDRKPCRECLVHDTSRIPLGAIPQRLLERDFSNRMEKRSWGCAHLFRPMVPDFLHAAPPTDACAAFIKESRMKFINAIKLDRKSGWTLGRTWGTRPISSGLCHDFSKSCQSLVNRRAGSLTPVGRCHTFTAICKILILTDF
jgi:hypothetical protein